MKRAEAEIATELVLIGGGHSHLFVLEHFAMNPLPGVRLTLVTRDLHTPYSGMLPGYIAGHYTHDEAHIDLQPLARRAGARIVHAEVAAIDADAGEVVIEGRPRLAYDLLSVNIGSRPSLPPGCSTDRRQVAVKPVDRFIRAWQQLEQRLQAHDGPLRLAVIGGGAGGVELALALDHRARQLGAHRAGLELLLVTDRDRLLPGHNRRAQSKFGRILQQRGIEVRFGQRVVGFDRDGVRTESGATIAADYAVWVTHAGAAEWLRDSGLELDARGFIAVNSCLQSRSHANVFAAGDIASVEGFPRPKSGVFAVRQGPPLARNLERWLQNQAPLPFTPQRQFLSLVSTGDRYAVLSRGPWALQGAWCWRLKDRIDRKFMRRFSSPEPMPAGSGSDREMTPMRCGGCGAKVGAQVLEQVLGRIEREFGVEIAGELEHADDAALIGVPPGMQLVQTVDHFRSFIDDPYLFGRIAANHALGDLYAMGVAPDSALVIANVVFASESRQAQDLYQLLFGVVETLHQDKARLVGGHSGEAAEMSCGLSVNGFARREDLLLKQGMRAGDCLLLCKPLGSGVLFAADMRGRARGEWIDAAIEQMLISARAACGILGQHEASACTDVTGFGLAGHLFEMARASGCAVELVLERLPLYPGALELSRQGIESTLKPQNLRIRHAIDATAEAARHEAYPLLFDPQTAGGLLASLPSAQAQACLQALRAAGYIDAAIIGRAVDTDGSGRSLRLLTA